MQSYKNKNDFSNIRQISGYAWLILVVNQEEIGARLGLSKNYVKHLPMFREYIDLLIDNNKKAYIYQCLADKYKMHPDSIKRVITKLLQITKV